MLLREGRKIIRVSKRGVNERENTPLHTGELAAFDISLHFDKDDLDIDPDIDVKNPKDAWILRLVYNDGNREDLSMVKPDDNKEDYIITSKDKLKAQFSDDNPKDKTLKVPKIVIDHIAKHIKQAERNIEDEKKVRDSDLAKEIAYDIKKEFPNYDMDIIEGDIGKNYWNIQIVYKNGMKDSFSIIKAGKSYLMKSKNEVIGKFSLEELKNFPSTLKKYIEKQVKKSKR